MSVVSPSEGSGGGSNGGGFLLSEGEAAAAANCNKFVEVLGLRAIFPLFMHSPQAKGAQLAAAIHEKSLPGPTSAEMEEHIIRCVYPHHAFYILFRKSFLTSLNALAALWQLSCVNAPVPISSAF